MQAIVDAINAHASTTGQRVAAKIVQEGRSVLGAPFDYVVIGTPDNIANLDSGRNDQAFWRGRDRRHHVAEGGARRRSTAGRRSRGSPARRTATSRPAARRPPRSSTNSPRAPTATTPRGWRNLDVFVQPVTAPDDRDHNNRTLAWAFDPNRDRGTFLMPENRALTEAIDDVPRACSSSTRTSSRRATSSRPTRTPR